jgi:hypothetical protein
MATAPRPGTTPLADAERNRTFVITVRGDKSVIRVADLGARDDALVRRETKMAGVEKVSLMGALSAMDEQTMGLDMICLLWWLGRRKSGDTVQSYGEALDAFPTYAEAEGVIKLEQEVDEDDDEDDGSPEA